MPLDNARSRGATGNVPAADTLRVHQRAADARQDARRVEGRRGIPAERAQRHPRSGHQNDVFTPSKRS